MSITTTSTKDSYTGNNSTSTPYPITFKYLEDSHITVYVDGVALSNSYYTLTGDGSLGTGQFTTAVAYADTKKVVVVLDVPFDQPVELLETGVLSSSTLEGAYDRLNMQIRRVWRKVGGVLTFATDEGGASTGTADTLLGFLSSGDLGEIPNSTFVESSGGIDNISDVTITSPSNGELLGWSGSAWVNTTVGNGDMLASVYDPNGVAGAIGTVQGTGATTYNIVATDEGAFASTTARGENSVDLQTNRDAVTQVSSGASSALVGGNNNTASNTGSAVIGGNTNTAAGLYSGVVAGQRSTAGGLNSIVLGGSDSTASGIDSLAAGDNATVTHNGARVFADSDDTNFPSIANNEFAIQGSALRLVDGNQGAGKVLTSDANGSGNWADMPADDVPYTPAGTGAVTTDVETKLRESVSVKDFGAVGDGVTDDRIAIYKALTQHANVYFPAGTYRVEVGSGVSAGIYVALANRALFGDDKNNTKIAFDVTDTGYKNLISPANGNFTMRGLTVEVDSIANGGMTMFLVNKSGLTIDDCTLDGGITDDGTTRTHGCHMIKVSDSGTQNDIIVQNSECRQFDFVFLKTNASTSTNRRVHFLNVNTNNNYLSDLGGFNSPNGIAEDIVVDGCTCTDNRGTSLATPLQTIPFGCASASNIRITNNYCSGTYSEVCHIEEDCENVVVSGNTFECNFDSSGSFINVLENNIATDAIVRNPRNVVIANNTMIYTGVAKEVGTFGVWVTFNGSATTAGNDVIISNNVVKNVAIGFSEGGYLDDGNVFTGNTAVNCAVGFEWGNFASALSNDNLSKDCDLGVKCNIGGMIDSHKFLGCTDNIVAGNNPIVLSNPTFLFKYFDIGATTTINQTLVPLSSNTRVYGDAIGLFNRGGGSDSSSVNVNLSYDGSALTDTSNYTLNNGVFQSSFAVDGTDLVYANYSNTAKTDAVAQVKFNGSISLES